MPAPPSRKTGWPASRSSPTSTTPKFSTWTTASTRANTTPSSCVPPPICSTAPTSAATRPLCAPSSGPTCSAQCSRLKAWAARRSGSTPAHGSAIPRLEVHGATSKACACLTAQRWSASSSSSPATAATTCSTSRPWQTAPSQTISAPHCWPWASGCAATAKPSTIRTRG